MEYSEVQVDKEKIIVVNDTVDIKVIKTDNGYNIKILENYTCPINIEFTDNVEEFEI